MRRWEPAFLPERNHLMVDGCIFFSRSFFLVANFFPLFFFLPLLRSSWQHRKRRSSKTTLFPFQLLSAAAANELRRCPLRRERGKKSWRAATLLFPSFISFLLSCENGRGLQQWKEERSELRGIMAQTGKRQTG